MKTKLALSFLLFLLLKTSYSEEIKFNCILFIDGKFPYGITNEKLTVVLENDTLIIPFKYTIGDIIIERKLFNKLINLNPYVDVLISFNHQKENGEIQCYSGKLKAKYFSYNYLVLRITNISNLESKYYFGYSTPSEIKAFIPEEYNMFEK